MTSTKQIPIPREWRIGSYYVIRDKRTGYIIPRRVKGTGSSYSEPGNPLHVPPRLFENEKCAKNFLGQWLRGRMHATGNWEDGFDIHVSPMAGRKRENMGIIPVALILENLP